MDVALLELLLEHFLGEMRKTTKSVAEQPLPTCLTLLMQNRVTIPRLHLNISYMQAQVC